MPRTFLKPSTYQVKPISSILIEDKIRLQSSINNSLTFYISNAINIERVFENNTNLTDKETITILLIGEIVNDIYIHNLYKDRIQYLGLLSTMMT